MLGWQLYYFSSSQGITSLYISPPATRLLHTSASDCICKPTPAVSLAFLFSTGAGGRGERASSSSLTIFGGRQDTSPCVRMEQALPAAQWVIGKALNMVMDGVLQAWAASKELGSNVNDLKTELLSVKATLEIAQGKQFDGPAQKDMLQNLRVSAFKAEDLLDELEYYRIQDKLYGTNDAADEHAKGCAHNLLFNARHAVKAFGSRLAPSSSAPDPGPGEDARQGAVCCAWPLDQAGEGSSGCMPKFGKLFHRSSSPPCEANQRAEQTPMLGFKRVDMSLRMKGVLEQLQKIHTSVAGHVNSSNPRIITTTEIVSRITISESVEPKLYGRDREVDKIIHDITKGKYREENLTVLPILGHGGIGKTTMTQHIYHHKDIPGHFDVVIWVCISVKFDVSKTLENIKQSIPRVEGEKEEDSTRELIEKRLKSKRFLLVLDDMWECSNEDDWKSLLLPLKKSQAKGSMILVTTRLPSLAEMVKTTEDKVELKGLGTEEFRKLFLAFVFGDYQSRKDHTMFLGIGEKIMEKLKGSPLAAKTIGGLLRKHLDLSQWEKFLESKEWETMNGESDIMPALKLSYDHLSFQLQQCFFYCALFPEDYKFDGKELIHFWIGLNILHECPNKSVEDIGMSSLNGLVAHGFLKKEETDGHPHYIMHDLLHDLALRVSSHECLSLQSSNMVSVANQPCIRHMSIIIDGVVSEHFRNELRILKDKLQVEDLQTLMFFGDMDRSYANIFADLFREAEAFRVIRLPQMPDSMESVVPKFSKLLHMRYLSLGTYRTPNLHLPDSISRFYHLRILDLNKWGGYHDLPRDITNLESLRHFTGPDDNYHSAHANIHSSICNVGKLKLLQELTAFIVNKENQGHEPGQLVHLTELRELRIYYLERIHEEEEADKAKVIDKTYLERMTLVWYGGQDNANTDVEGRVLDSLRPHKHLQQLYISGHRGRSCPKWLGGELDVNTLKYLRLFCVSWEVTPSFGKMPDLRELILEYMAKIVEFGLEQPFSMLTRVELISLERLKKWVAEDTHLFHHLRELIIKDCPALLELPFSDQQDSNKDRFRLLQKLEIVNCPKVLSLPPIPWTETLCFVLIKQSKLPSTLRLSESTLELRASGRGNLDSLDQILVFENLTELESLTLENLHDIQPPYCPPLEWKHLPLLKSLKKFIGKISFGSVVPVGGQGDVQWHLPIEDIFLRYSEASGEEMTWLLRHLPKLSQLNIEEQITQLVPEVDLQQTTTPVQEVEGVESVAEEKGGRLVLPAHLSNSLEKLEISAWRLPKPMWLVIYPLHALQNLRILEVKGASRCKLATFSSSFYPFPSSLQHLKLEDVLGLENLKPLSNLTSLRKLQLIGCGKHLRCEGLAHLLTRGQLSELNVKASIVSELDLHGSPTQFFVGWAPRQQLHKGDEQASPKLQIKTEGIAAVMTVSICSFLSSFLTSLYFGKDKEIEYFNEAQEQALQLLTSLEELTFACCRRLQRLPEGLKKLTKLMKLTVHGCEFIDSLPKDGLPSSLHELDVKFCDNEELKRQCMLIRRTIPILRLEDSVDGIYFN
uniref:Uncharacterized protein n=1 Tax=Avena sativa TaxID=4498 RepID=A0ACD5TSL9_AVESA